MQKTFLATLAAVALVGQADAMSVSFLDSPYEFLDSIVMKVYKPLIWYVVIGWSQNFACDYIIENFLTEFIENNDLTADE